jgi:hypothetical protein
MITVHRAAASAVRATSFVFLSALIVSGSFSESAGTTDIYANDFARSFGVDREPSASSPHGYNGSTDAWGVNGFRASFGPVDLDARPTNLCGVGSTDIWGANGFSASFGAPAIKSPIALGQACYNVLR